MEVKLYILKTIELNKLKWYDHVYRMSSNYLPKFIIDWNPNRKRRNKVNWNNLTGTNQSMRPSNVII